MTKCPKAEAQKPKEIPGPGFEKPAPGTRVNSSTGFELDLSFAIRDSDLNSQPGRDTSTIPLK
jgi:hypothetical protein